MCQLRLINVPEDLIEATPGDIVDLPEPNSLRCLELNPVEKGSDRVVAVSYTHLTLPTTPYV